MPRKLMLMCLLAGIGGCSDFPQLDSAISEQARAASYPSLAPINVIVSAARPLTEVDPVREMADLTARTARLRQRAAILRGSVVDDATRARLAAAMARQAG